MREWFDTLAGPEYTDAILWTLAALVAFVVLLIIIRIIRRMTFGTFVAGGRNRKTRLAVMDATAVDSHRRLVLVRRDDVEHLLLIGGAADLVVERDIRLYAPQRRPALAPEANEQPQPQRPRVPEAVPPRTTQVPRATQPPREMIAPLPQPESRPAPPRVPPAPVAQRATPPNSGHPPMPVGRPPMPVRQPPRDDLDDTLMKELEVSLEAPPARPKPPISLDDEMTRLLGELSSHKR